MQLHGSEIALRTPDIEEGRAAFGRFRSLEQFDMSASDISARRPRDWPDATEQLYLNYVWSMPESATQAELVLGDMITVPINLGVAATHPPAPAAAASFEIRSLRRVDRIDYDGSRRDADYDGVILPRFGSILELEFEANALMDTDPGEDFAFRVDADKLALAGPEGVALTHLGSVSFSGQYFLTPSISDRWDADESPGDDDQALFFHGTGAPGVYTLFYLTDSVASVQLQ